MKSHVEHDLGVQRHISISLSLAHQALSPSEAGKDGPPVGTGEIYNCLFFLESKSAGLHDVVGPLSGRCAIRGEGERGWSSAEP